MMNDFSKAMFLALGSEARERMCALLGSKLSTGLQGGSLFHTSVAAVVEELRSVGHDLWSMDEGDGFEVWAPNYVKPSGPGLVITFSDEDDVLVEWSDT